MRESWRKAHTILCILYFSRLLTLLANFSILIPVLGQLSKIIGRNRNTGQEKGRGLGDAEEQAELSTRADIKQEHKKTETIVGSLVYL